MARTVTLLRDGPVRSRVVKEGVTLEQDATYHVYVDSLSDDRLDILTNTAGLPQAGLSTNAYGLMCKTVSLNVHPNNGRLYVVTAQFASDVNETQDSSTSGVTTDPTEWVPQVELEFEPYEEMMQEDLDGKKALNAAGDWLEQGVTIIKHIPVRTFTQYENCDPYTVDWADGTYYRVGQTITDSSGEKFQCLTAGFSSVEPSLVPPGGWTAGDIITDPTTLGPPAVFRQLATSASNAVTIDELEDRCNTTNLSAFLGRPIGTLLLDIRKATIGTYYGYRLWKIEYSLKYKADGWKDKRLNMGYRYKDTSTAEKIAAGGKFFFQDKMTGAHFLGKLNADGTACADQIADDPSILEFRNKGALDFNTFLRIV